LATSPDVILAHELLAGAGWDRSLNRPSII
jgi:hypothetical protein